jgi:uncharacterized protein with NAD-binding domain and iron-sulfur cluster
MVAQPEQDVIVVGGGLAGLSCAVALADAGLRVRVLEASSRLGGRARSWTHVPTGDTVDIGPHVVHSEYQNFLAFLTRLGTRGQIVWQPRKLITFANANADGAAALVHRRGLTPPLSLLPDVVRASRLPPRELVSNNRVTWRAMTFGEDRVDALDRLTGIELLRECRVRPGMIDWFWRFASMAVLNVPLECVSAAALLRVHSQLIGRRGVHFGFPAIGLGELYVEQSVAALRRAGGEVCLDYEAARIDLAPGRLVVHSSRGHAFAASQLVVALPPHEARALHAGLVEDRHPFEPSRYKSLYLWFDRKLTDERFWALRWSPDRLNYDFYDLANVRPALRGRPSLVTSNVIHSQRVDGLDEEALVRRTVAEIETFAPQAAKARVLHADVHHVPMAIPAPTPGFERARPPNETALDGVYLAGDWTRTALPCSMDSAVRSGWLAAECVLRRRGRDANLAIEPRGNDGLAGLVQRAFARPREFARRSC